MAHLKDVSKFLPREKGFEFALKWIDLIVLPVEKKDLLYLTFNKCAILIMLMYTKMRRSCLWKGLQPIHKAMGMSKVPQQASRSLMFFFVTKSRLAPCWYFTSIVTHGAQSSSMHLFSHDKFCFSSFLSQKQKQKKTS